MRNRISSFLMAALAVIGVPLAVSAQDGPMTTLSSNIDSPQTITITREISGLASSNPVVNAFTYAISADASNPAEAYGYPEEVELVFDSVVPDLEHIATSTATLDFSNTGFKKVGDYTFSVREIATRDEHNYPIDADANFLVTISVRNEMRDGVYTGNIVPTMAMQALNVETNEKTDIKFESAAERSYLQLSKEVSGNAADRDEYFRFEFDIAADGRGAIRGDAYTVTGQDATVVYNGEEISTSNQLVVGTKGYVYLKHGQTITIGHTEDGNELPVHLGYYVKETAAEGYTSTLVSGDSFDLIRFIERLNEDGSLPSSNILAYVNHKESAVSTGVAMVALPILFVVLLSLGGVALYRKKCNSVSKKR